MAPTSIKFLELVVGASASPAFQPTFNAFPTNVAAAEGDGGGYAVLGWADGDLSTVDRYYLTRIFKFKPVAAFIPL